MKMQIWSRTRSGKWASIFTLLFIVLMALKLSALAKAIRLPFPSPAIALLGIIGFVFGIVSFFKDKERSLLAMLSLPVGLLIIFWVAAEIVFSH